MTLTSIQPAFAGLLPHPPIVIPAVGQDRITECQQTTNACREFARRMNAARPDRLVLVSPHAPRKKHAFGIYAGDTHRGDLSRFGARGVAVVLPNDAAVTDELHARAPEAGIETWSIIPTDPEHELDHGSVVPLWFLQEAGWRGPTTVVSLPWQCDAESLHAFGREIAAAVATQPGSTALVASGDMTHRAKPGAPAGYHKNAVEFDRVLTAFVREGRLDKIPEIDDSLRQLAAEDAADSSMVIAAAIGFAPHGPEVLSYEHPFGVGYLVAVFHDGKTQGAKPQRPDA